jgi:hypothetical protein
LTAPELQHRERTIESVHVRLHPAPERRFVEPMAFLDRLHAKEIAFQTRSLPK